MTDARELLALYAVDALDEHERRAVEELVARDPEAAAELDELRATAALLGSAVAEPPPASVRDAVLAEVAGTEQLAPDDDGELARSERPAAENGAEAATDLPDGLDLRSGTGPQAGVADAVPEAGTADAPEGVDADVVPLADRRRASGPEGAGPRGAGRGGAAAGRRRTSSVARLALVAAAAVVLAVAVPGTIAWQQHERAVLAEGRAELLADVLSDPGATLVRGPVEGGGEAVAVLTPARALLVADGLPALDGDRTYQLWAMRDGVPVPAGLLDLRDGATQQLADDYRPGDGLAVSVEPAGGSEQPTTTPVVVLLPG